MRDRIGRAWYHSPSRAIRAICGVIRATSSSSIIAWSATSSMKTSGTLVTTMPAAVAASMSTMSTPTLPTPITTHCFRFVDHLLVDAEAPRGDDRVDVGDARGELRRRVGADLDDLRDRRQAFEFKRPALLDGLVLRLLRQLDADPLPGHAMRPSRPMPQSRVRCAVGKDRRGRGRRRSARAPCRCPPAPPIVAGAASNTTSGPGTASRWCVGAVPAPCLPRLQHAEMKDDHIAWVDVPLEDVEAFALGLDVGQPRQGRVLVERRGVVVRGEGRPVVEHALVRAPNELETVLLSAGGRG